MTLTNLKLAFGAIVIAGATAALVVQHQAQARLHDQNESLQQQLGQLQSDNDTLSNQLAAADSSRSTSQQQFNELLKLRSQVGLLQRQVAELGKLRAENERLQALRQNSSSQPAGLSPEAQEQKMARQKVDDAKQCLLGMRLFAADNQQQCPTNFDQITYPTDTNVLSEIANTFDFVYQGTVTNIASPGDIIVLREKQSWPTVDGTWSKVYGFADGHVEIHTVPDGNFNDWENQHIIPPAPSP
jgi:myosin heavy subunit